MISEWKECTIAELGYVAGGATPSTKEPQNYDGGHIPWITPKDLSTFSGRYISRGGRNITEKGLKSCSAQMLPKHSILFSSRAPIGYIAIADCPLCTNQGFKSVIPNENTDYLFLYYLLKYNKEKIENMGSGTTFKEVSGATMKSIKVSVPISKCTQHIIGNILGNIDDKIELNNAINENLHKQVKALFKAWFVDYIPFDGVLPNDWIGTTLGSIVDITSGKRPFERSLEKSQEFSIPLVGAASIMGFTNAVLYNEKILVTGRVGTHGVIQRFSNECWTSDNTLVIKSPYYEFVYQVLHNIDYSNMNRGSTQPLITQSDLKKVPIFLPTTNILDKFESIAGVLMAKYEKNVSENDKLVTLRDTLLPKLMSGEIDVSDVEI